MRIRIFSAALALAIGVIGAAPQPVAAQSLSGSYLAGRQASYSGDFAAAAQYYAQALRSDPGRAELLERAALSFMSIGNVSEAAGFARQIEEAGLRSQIGHMAIIAELGAQDSFEEILSRINDTRGVGPLADGLLKAWSQLGGGDMTSALVSFDAVAEQRGLGGFAAYHKALALASVGDFQSADTILASDAPGAMRMTRRAVMAHAEILSQLQRNDDAIALLERSFGADLDPGLQALKTALEEGQSIPFSHIRSARDGAAEVFYSLAGALANDAEDDFTLLYSRIASHLRPDHVDAILLSGELLQSLNQHALAVEEYSKVARDDFAFHAAELGRAEALRDSGKQDAAVEVLERLAESHADLPIVHATLGDTKRQLEDFEAAVAAYSRALELHGEQQARHWFIYYARAISYERLDRWDEAEADFRTALELNPDQPNVLNYLGYSLVEKQIKLDEALDMIQRAVAAQPNSGFIVDSLGWALFRLGRYKEAVEPMERAAELMAVDPVVNDHLGDVYWAVGREREARFQWNRALSFVDYGSSAEEVDADRIRRKLEVGLDVVLSEEGAPPLGTTKDDN